MAKVFVQVSGSQRLIKKVISQGGSAMVKVGREFRCLQHLPEFDRPARRLPWPFCKLQPFRFSIIREIVSPGKIVGGIEFPSKERGDTTETEYNQTQVEQAIEIFLKGCRPDDEVSISVR